MKEKLKAFWDSLNEWEILTIIVFAVFAGFSERIWNIVFFMVGKHLTVSPGYERFHYALYTLAIWVGFWLAVWGWLKLNFPEIINYFKNEFLPYWKLIKPLDANDDALNLEEVKQITAYHGTRRLIIAGSFVAFLWATLLGTAWAVFT